MLTKRGLKGDKIKAILLKFVKNLSMRWKKSKNNKSKFLKSNEVWLRSLLLFSERECNEPQPGPSKVGRPVKSFSECGNRAKQKKAKKLTSTCSTEELSFAVQSNLRKSGKRYAAEIIDKVSKDNISSPKRITKVKRLLCSPESEKSPCLTEDQALALIINTRSSKSTYLAYRMAAKSCKSNLYPSWNKILAAKSKCYPEPGKVIAGDIGAEIDLQALLNLTALRLCILQKDVLESYSGQHLNLICE